LHLKHPPVDVDSLDWEHRLLATAEQPPAGGARTGAGSRRLNLVLVSRRPHLADPLGAGPPCRPGRPARCRHGARPFARVSGGAVHPTKPCPAATAAAAAITPNPSVPRTVAHRHRPGPHRPERDGHLARAPTAHQ
jgi:hypothetical protein